MMGKNTGKVNIPMVLAIILLFLTLLSMHLTGGLYARYIASAQASQGARVAKFQVSGTAGENVILDCRDTAPGEYAITVDNGSEVAVEYTLALVFSEAVPAEDVSVTLDDGAGAWSADGKTLTFAQAGALAPNAGAQTHTLAFVILDWSYVTGEVTGAGSAEKTLDFTINLTVAQVD